MSYKRPRAVFETEGSGSDPSSFVVYGTPLPSLDSNARDDGSYVPVWKQEVVDERGRKRLHGAFTGGFSAGYFNTVGSRRGWTPSNFVSSRANKKNAAGEARKQRPEDFMDEEDLADAEENRRLKTKEKFSELGSTDDDGIRRSTIMDLLKPSGDTKGYQLLWRMGWREGQGLGPKVRRRANLGDGDPGDGPGDVHLFSPADSNIISLVRKDDSKGLGYQDEARLGKSLGDNRNLGPADDSDTEKPAGPSPLLRTKQKPRGGLGVGILNDTGSDDEDPYTMGPRISYNKTIGSDKKKKKKDQTKPAIGTANPLLKSAPVFLSKKESKLGSDLRKCHDGRLPLDGFVLASMGLGTQELKFPPPPVPDTWKLSKTANNSFSELSKYQSVADEAKTSNHDPASRAKMLGEALLPGKSVFEFLKPNARDRIVNLTRNEALPEAGSEAFSLETPQMEPTIPELDAQIAKTALGRGVSGFVPYSDNPDKLARYRAFLSYKAGLTLSAPSLPSGMRRDEWVKELQEFAHAATIFKPMTGLMASRFTSSNPAVTTSSGSNDNGDEELLVKPQEKRLDPAEEAAQMGMFGPLTRSSVQFYPSRLLCKRFNVPVPSHVTAENEGSAAAVAVSLPTKAVSEEQTIRPSVIPEFGSRFKSSGFQAGSGQGSELLNKADMETLAREAGLDISLAKKEVEIQPDKNEALEVERPGEAVFKAIFGESSEDD